MHEHIEFIVTICKGYGDGGDVAIFLDVSDQEYAALKDCVREGMEMDERDVLASLCDRLAEEAKDESCFACDDKEEEDYDDASYIFQIPDEIYEAVENEDHPQGDDAIEARALELLHLAENDFDVLNAFIEGNEDSYSGELNEFVFRKAVESGNLSYVEEHYEDIELNDDGGSSSYLEIAESDGVREFLLEVGAYWSWDHYDDFTFAMETINGSVLACDDNLLDELREKYLAETGLTEDDIVVMLVDEENIPDDFDRDFETDISGLCWTVHNGHLCPGNPVGEENGWAVKELLEEFGWECEFEGDMWKLETNGVYFIE